MLLTGSVFENDEGAGRKGSAFLTLGLSKALTYQMFRYYAGARGSAAGQVRDSQSLWPVRGASVHRLPDQDLGERQSRLASKRPLYVRDNIHVSLLAKCYAQYARAFTRARRMELKLNPSGYVESQGALPCVSPVK